MRTLKILAAFAVLALSSFPAIAQTNCRVSTSAPSYVDGTTAPLSCDTSGALRSASGGVATQNVNLSQVNGAAPSLTNPIYVQPATAALPWNVTVNAALPAGSNIIGNVRIDQTTPGTTNGVQVNAALPAGSNIIGNVRIDQTTPGTTNGVQVNAALPAGANTIGAVTQASGPWTFNQTQINGTAVSADNGSSNSGTQRVAVASTNSAVALWGHGATGSAVPANATYAGVRNSSGLAGNIACDSSIVYDASTNGSTELVALTASQTIYVCGYSILAAGTVNVELDYGTGTACATGTTKLTPAYQLTAQAGVVDGAPYWRGMKGAVSNALCLKTSAGIAVQAVVYYTKF